MSMPSEPVQGQQPPAPQPAPGTQLQVPVEGAPPATQYATSTNNGFLTGVDDPATGMSAAELAAAQQAGLAAQQNQAPVQLVDQQPEAPSGRVFTEADVARIRQEEKEKLYGRQEEMQATIAELQAAEQQRRQEAEERQAAEAEQRPLEEEAAMTETQLMQRRQEELAASVEELRQDNARKDALIAQEQRFNQLSDFKRDMMAREEEFIMPELRDMVGGSSEEEIVNSIEQAKQKTAAILANMQEAALVQRQQTPGVSSTGAPPVGPMEQASSHETFSADEISNMDMATYIANRDRLLRASSPTYRG